MKWLNRGWARLAVLARALPEDATITPFEDLGAAYYPPYREAKIQGWHVYYFDTTNATSVDPAAIRVEYRPGIFTPQDFDPFLVDSSR